MTQLDIYGHEAPRNSRRFSWILVGAIGFEPTTPCAQGRCATRLRYAPTVVEDLNNYSRRRRMTPRPTRLLHCSSAFHSSFAEGGSARPPSWLARNASVAANHFARFSGRTNPWPLGTGPRTGPGAIRKTKVDISQAARN